MQIDRINEWNLTPALETEIAEFLQLVFKIGFDGRSFYMQRHNLRLTLREDGQLLGHMALSLRAIRLDDRLTDMVGLAEVSTHPDARGRGVASTLLKEAISAAQETVAPYFLLFGDAPLYAGHGFRPVANEMRYTDLSGAKTNGVKESKASHLMVLELGDEPWPEDAKLDLVGWLF